MLRIPSVIVTSNPPDHLLPGGFLCSLLSYLCENVLPDLRFSLLLPLDSDLGG